MSPPSPKILASTLPLVAAGIGVWLAHRFVPPTSVATSAWVADASISHAAGGVKSEPKATPALKQDPAITSVLASTDPIAAKALIDALTFSQLMELCFSEWPKTIPPELSVIMREALRRFSVEERLKAFMGHVPGKTQWPQVSDAVLDLATDLLPAKTKEIMTLLTRFMLNNYRCQPMLEAWAEADSVEAMSIAKQLQLDPQSIAKLLIPLARRDLAAAKTQALDTSDDKLRWSLMTEVAAVMADSDLMAALTWTHENGKVPWSNKLSNSGPAGKIFERIASKDPLRAAECLAQNPGFFSMDRGPCEALFQEWARKDISAASAWLAAHPLPDNLQQVAVRELFQAGVEKMSPSEAVTAWELLPGSLKANQVHTLTRALMKDDPDLALRTLKSGVKDPETLSNALLAMFDTKKFTGEFLIANLADFKSLVEKNPKLLDDTAKFPEAQRAQIVAALSPEAQGASAKLELGRLTKQQSFEAALILAEATGLENQDGGDSAFMIASAAELLPQRVADFVSKQTENESRAYAAQNLVMTWAKTDPAGAAAWARALEPGATRDNALKEIIRINAVAGDARVAMELAAQITDPKNQISAYGRALQGVWNQDLNAAKALLETTKLDAKARADLESNLQNGRVR